tara:strand:- start:79 stop:501 length:423 start_codon:yes stop_codon:yes gene_type:complete
MRERYYIDNNNCINKNSPIRTKDEKKTDHSEYSKVYYYNNKDKIKAYLENNKDKIKAYNEANKDKINERQKVYNEANKDKISERGKAYNEANKDKISEHRKQKVVCECGCEMRRSSLTGHRKSKFHQEFIQSLASGGNTI